MLSPSRADAEVNDPTITRCIALKNLAVVVHAANCAPLYSLPLRGLAVSVHGLSVYIKVLASRPRSRCLARSSIKIWSLKIDLNILVQ